MGKLVPCSSNRYYVSGLRKMGKLVPCSFFWNISPLLSSLQGVRPVDQVGETIE